MGKYLAMIAAGVSMVGGLILMIVLSADFAPDGVPLARRAEYETKVSQIRLNESVARRNYTLIEQGHANPKVVVDGEDHDFGLMDPHTSGSHAFIIRNEGNADLVLESDGTSCKCTVSTVDSRPIKPGEQTEVMLTWNTGYQAEVYEQTATVKTNDLLRNEIKLTVHGQVRAELVNLYPELQMSPVDAGQMAETATYLYSQLWDDFVVESVTSDLPGFHWSVEPVSNDALPLGDLEARSAWKLNLTAMPIQKGSFMGKVSIQVTPAGGGDAVQRELTIKGSVRPTIAFVDPNLRGEKGLEMGIIHRGVEHHRSLVVRVRDGRNRKIDVLDVKPAALRATLKPTKVDGAYRLTITIPANSEAVMFNREDQHGYVQIGDREDPKFQNWLPIYGSIVNPPTTSK